MSDCSCTPNKSIKCSVTQCANHCKDGNYCALNTIQVGTHEANPTEVKCTPFAPYFFSRTLPEGPGISWIHRTKGM